MKNTPFRFLDSTAAFDELSARVLRFGYQLHRTANDSELRLTPHNPSDVDCLLRWGFNWWPDGIFQEDATVSLVVADQTVCVLNVAELLHQRFNQPLRLEVAERICEMITKSTGPAT